MKKAIVFFLLLFAANVLCAQEKTILEGIYQGKNIFVQNPVKNSGTGFCVDSVSVNGIVQKEKIQSSAFEIDFPSFKLKPGDTIKVVLYHSGNCMPKVLNPYVGGYPRCTFKETWIDSAAVFHFVTCEENGTATYTVQQFRWNKWVKIGELTSAANVDPQEYTFDVKPFLFKGENKFRAVLPYSKNISATASYTADVPELIVDATSWCNVIAFSGETMWELYDVSGNIVKKGFGTQLDYTGLASRRPYYLNYANTTKKIKLKKCTPEEKKDEPDMKNGVSVYPNPANTDINISTDKSYAGAILIVEISDNGGRRVKGTEIQGGTTVAVSVAELPDGIYFVRVFRGDERVSSQKIAVRH